MAVGVETGAKSSLSQRDESSIVDGEIEKIQLNWTEEEERALVRKVDWHILPGLTLLYLLSFLDRSNVGNAKLEGLLVDINATDPAAYNTGLALYFLGYVLFEVPANIVLKRLNPKIWLPTITVSWGITATLQGLVRSQPGFYAARFFLGVAEAGLFPGTIFVFSMYYKRRERHWRVAIFFGGAALAGAFGGILAFAIAKMDGVGGQPGWAWIFYLEGILTTLVGLSGYYWVPGYPHDAKFLSNRDHQILIARLAADSDAADREPFRAEGVFSAFSDHLVWAYGFLFHGFAFPLYSLSLFLPTIIAGLGFASWKAQLLTVPTYSAAFAFIVLLAWLSHRSNRRAPWIVASGFLGIIGYIVILTTSTAGKRYVGTYLSVMGIYGANALLLSWPAENVSPQTKRATVTAMQIFVGDIGAIAGVLIYRPNLAQHFYRKPHLIAIGYTLFGVLAAGYLWFWMRQSNRRRDLRLSQLGTDVEAKDKVIQDSATFVNGVRQGDRHVAYRYQL
ncbi:MFS general substrate transporter [Punctularia strigosozonata HHB-11173 SS5]|uniref:MFS general substrate transporter n=1 Tax=Punctularia strigosozonata (strain HHB-11173) TaxID=741275 RepID=R7S466_PUNST|nr:MFS general substrate transporter [Punctularia strigosozonata HHB-11173 SS5]EIN04644.1 MFS general substrate transporter [Punctularia strigosozonata HHB-11173 SS5]